LKGDYAGSCRETEFYRLAAKPLAQVYGVFDALWQELGGSLEGGAGYGEVPGDARLLYSVESRPLRELIADMNKFSNNVMTRQLLLSLGAEVYGPPGTEAKGRDAVETWLRLRGIDTEGLILDNGSGLSRRSRISAAQLAAMLHYAYSQPDMPEYVSSMAVLGIDGTMAHRFRNSPLTGRGHLKSGSLKDANNIAGYLQTRSGQRMVVVLFYNAAKLNRGDVRRFQDQLLEWLYEQ
jgi:D-alanyl-D-alanine carboxypeptidase/D-alanyl-D-alanine-endopeptidase (penicillin-binding protein 4)